MLGGLKSTVQFHCFQDNAVFFIDEGPLLPSLEHLVEYYCLRADGLPSRLTFALSPSQLNVPNFLF